MHAFTLHSSPFTLHIAADSQPTGNSKLSDLITLGSRWTFVGGKGGTGKTTTAAALAVELATMDREVLVLSVDPAHSLGDALRETLGPEPTAMVGIPHLAALEVDADHERRRFMERGRADLIELLEHGTYLDRDDIEEFADLSLPGADELAALLRLMELAKHTTPYAIVDLAPTGHALRLLDLPSHLAGWLDALDALEAKNRAVSLALVGAYTPGAPAELLTGLRADLATLDALLTDPERTRFVLVTNPQPAVLAETRRLADSLSRRSIALGGVVLNRSDTGSLTDLANSFVPEQLGRSSSVPLVFVPTLSSHPDGPEGLRAFAAFASAQPTNETTVSASRSPLSLGAPFSAPTEATLYLVGGKGGVGKSTTAAALAIDLAQRGEGSVLLLSIDPAGSLGDLLGIEVGAEPRPLASEPSLFVQQLDARAGWEKLRRDFSSESDDLASEILSGGQWAEADREVLARLIDLAPPGIDELVSLAQVVDLTEDRPYDAIVLDTAPTGHFLRFLATPELALEWTHAVLRLLLKYREVVGLGRLAERVLSISRSVGALQARLRDPSATWFLAVALPESLSVPETRRLLDGVRAHGVSPAALLINRLISKDGDIANGAAEATASLRQIDHRIVLAAAPDLPAPLAGTAALAEFAHSWMKIAGD